LKGSSYVTIVKRGDGKIVEFDSKNEAPRRLCKKKGILNESKHFEMLFYLGSEPVEETSEDDDQVS
jgi:hypothetical protein